MLFPLVLLGLIGASFAQTQQCTCSIQVPLFFWPILDNVKVATFDAVPVSDCGERGWIDCDYTCATQAADFFAKTDYAQVKPDDTQGRTWGQFMCDTIKENDPLADSVTTVLEGYGELCGEEYYIYFDETEKFLCCDVVGNHIPNC